MSVAKIDKTLDPLSEEYLSPDSCPCPIGIANTSGEIAGCGYAKASISPYSDVILTISPSLIPSSLALFKLISTQVDQVTVVIGSGVA